MSSSSEDEASDRDLERLAKRILDLWGASFGLVALSPLLAATALAIRATMGAPVLFRQKRPGKMGRPFTIYKFRTMKQPRAEEVWFRTDEERLTKLGRLLRGLSIDELPELINVLKGEMSLVGPRPLLTEYLEKYTKEEMRRHEVVPGITGFAQVNGRQTISFGKRIELDVWYVDHWSFWLDLSILLRTVKLAFSSEGVISGQDVDVVDDLGLSADRPRVEAKRGHGT